MSESFDYIIIGAGSAGCVMANRLALEGGTRVCVLEAGPRDSNIFIHIPAGWYKTVYDANINWLYETEPSDGTAGRRIAQPRGKTLGGSGSINGNIYNRGQRLDFDTWAQMGNRGWSYADILPYFKRGEKRIGEGDDRFHGRNGALTITDLDWKHPLIDAFIEGSGSLGIPHNRDYNGETQIGVSTAQRTIHRGRRMSPARAFLHPARKSTDRLDVRTEAHVEHILFEGKRAVGVRYLRGGKSHEVRAEREVILAAGVFNSPQILHRSGVGPADLLADIGVPVVHTLAGVGENLRDHVAAPVVARVKGVQTINELSHGLPLAGEVLKYLFTRRGLLAIQVTLVYLSWHSDEAVRNTDISLCFIPASYRTDVAFGLNDYPGMTAAAWQHRTESKGYVRARSTDPFEAPIIQPNYLAEEIDRRAILSAVRLARRIYATPAMARYVEAEELPGPAIQSDDELLDFCRQNCGTGYHPMGTCRMGPASDATAVVDDELRVHGMEGLRVVDASIMPTMPSGNLNAPTLMIGEKASDMILGRAPLPAVELDNS